MEITGLPYLFALAFVAVVAFHFGRSSTKEPSEETMIERLVQIRTERKMEKWTREALETEIETAAQARAVKL